MQKNYGNSAAEWAFRAGPKKSRQEISNGLVSKKVPATGGADHDWYLRYGISATGGVEGCAALVYSFGNGSFPGWLAGRYLDDGLCLSPTAGISKTGVGLPARRKEPIFAGIPFFGRAGNKRVIGYKAGCSLVDTGSSGDWVGQAPGPVLPLLSTTGAMPTPWLFSCSNMTCWSQGVKKEKRYPRVSRTQTGLTSTTADHHNRILFS